MKKMIIGVTLSILFFSGCAHLIAPKGAPHYDYRQYSRAERDIHRRVEKFLTKCLQKGIPVTIYPQVRIEKVQYDRAKRQIAVYLNDYFAYIPFRPENTAEIYTALRKQLGWRYRHDALVIYSLKQPIEQLIPNHFRRRVEDYDHERLAKPGVRLPAIVRSLSKPYQPTKGLAGYNLALWASHGWYWNQKMERWEWQRPRLFETVEDLLPTSFVLPFLLPMLENAGAYTFIPRERDIQTNEVIVDNDGSSEVSLYRETEKLLLTQTKSGFAIGKPPYPVGVNPFTLGTSRFFVSDSNNSARIQWIPVIPEAGEYAVYIAYQSDSNSVTDAHYTVYHSGGKTEYSVNQQIGGGTWIYLGRFYFKAGFNPQIGCVELTLDSKENGKLICADAVRFGGGMGNVSRGSTISGRPRFMEAARYYLQYAGFPDTLVFSLNDEKDDYVDDYQSRGEWVNYLNGRPCGPNKDRNQPGLGIPIDLSLAFHTDAGIAYKDIIGTLSIYSIEDFDSALVFPNRISRYVNRDLADIVQTQIVDDIRAKWEPNWKRRQLFNRQYSEAFRPNVPAMLLELLSHQNFNDMQYALDPRFRFDVSRAIYKGILKFIATQNQSDYVVQPLPVSHFQAVLTEPRSVRLKWQPVLDSLERSARPTKYIVYTRRDDGGFDNGTVVNQPGAVLKNLQPGVIYSFKVTAVNEGGESFPSEILSVCYLENDNPTVLIINGFDRVCAPATVNTPTFAGFAGFYDRGVPYLFDLDYTGTQFDFDPKSPWTTNDRPGWGASSANWETTVIPGNTFDFSFVHGSALRAAGYSFCAVSDEAVMDGKVDLSKYPIIDLILGEEKETASPNNRFRDFKTFPAKLQKIFQDFCSRQGKLFVSGSYIGTDLFASNDSTDIRFAQKTLKYKWVTHHAAKRGECFAPDGKWLPKNEILYFNTDYHPQIYTVEAPDAVEPVDTTGRVILRYTENQFSAGVIYDGEYKIVALGFPFETIISDKQRTQLMANIMQFFTGGK